MGRWIAAAVVFAASAGLTFWFALVHTVHSGTVTVPDLAGLAPEQAEKVCHDLGLALRVDPAGAVSGEVPVGKIAVQEPPAGFHLKGGSTVTVRLSMGDAVATVPPLDGISLQAALRDLEAEGLEPGRRFEVAGEAGGEEVVASAPPAGAHLPPGTPVDLLINTRPARRLWITPAFLGRSGTLVRSFCRRHGLRLGQVHEVEYPGVAPGVVLRQYPPAGSPLSRSDIISLWVSR